MQSLTSLVQVTLLFLVDWTTAFSTPITSLTSLTSFRRNSHLHVLTCEIVDATLTIAASTLISTIDSDVASIPENEFRPVFIGGVVVMFGGLVSALIVGFIIDSRNLYADLVADSYEESGMDEAFWKGLSDEEKAKAHELIVKANASKTGGSNSQGSDEVRVTPWTTSVAKQTEIERKEIGNFNDYGKDS